MGDISEEVAKTLKQDSQKNVQKFLLFVESICTVHYRISQKQLGTVK
jgi:hypothetical protein